MSSFSNLIVRIIFIFLLPLAEPDFPVTWLVFADPGFVGSGWWVVWHFDVSLGAGIEDRQEGRKGSEDIRSMWCEWGVGSDVRWVGGDAVWSLKLDEN
jgi:hypothetical protein